MPRPATLAEDLAEGLRKEILDGRWSDRPLPSERELSAKMGVARLTARRALKRLCAEQLIEARPGRGYVIVGGAAGGDATTGGREIIFFFLDRSGKMMPSAIDSEILSGASVEARQKDLVVYSTCQEPEGFKRIVRERMGDPLRGVLLDWARRDVAEFLIEAGVPFVVVEDDIEGLPVASVVQDNAGGTRAALEHLAELGHQRIGLVISTQKSFHPIQRQAAYREFMLRSGPGVSPELISRAPGGTEGGRKAAARLLDLPEEERPTAIYVASGGMLEGVTAEIRERGLWWPKDISLVTWSRAGEHGPAGDAAEITGVSWDHQELGKVAMLALEERIRVGRPERMVMRIEARLVDRGSASRPRSASGSRIRKKRGTR